MNTTLLQCSLHNHASLLLEPPSCLFLVLLPPTLIPLELLTLFLSLDITSASIIFINMNTSIPMTAHLSNSAPPWPSLCHNSLSVIVVLHILYPPVNKH